jgi:hypothetical protein
MRYRLYVFTSRTSNLLADDLQVVNAGYDWSSQLTAEIDEQAEAIRVRTYDMYV